MTHSKEKVDEAIRLYRLGAPIDEISKALGIAKSTVIRWAGPSRYRKAWRA